MSKQNIKLEMITELFHRQDELQKEAYGILKDGELMSLLSEFGNPRIVGSLASGLMTWRDIDIEIENQIEERDYWQAIRKVFKNSRVGMLTIADHRNLTNIITPNGLYIGVKYSMKQSEVWKIDIWFVPPRQPGAENFNEWLLANLQEQHRLPILLIKHQIASHPRYRKEIFSVDIYRAVIEHGVTDIPGFEAYLRETNRTL